MLAAGARTATTLRRRLAGSCCRMVTAARTAGLPRRAVAVIRGEAVLAGAEFPPAGPVPAEAELPGTGPVPGDAELPGTGPVPGDPELPATGADRAELPVTGAVAARADSSGSPEGRCLAQRTITPYLSMSAKRRPCATATPGIRSCTKISTLSGQARLTRAD